MVNLGGDLRDDLATSRGDGFFQIRPPKSGCYYKDLTRPTAANSRPICSTSTKVSDSASAKSGWPGTPTSTSTDRHPQGSTTTQEFGQEVFQFDSRLRRIRKSRWASAPLPAYSFFLSAYVDFHNDKQLFPCPAPRTAVPVRHPDDALQLFVERTVRAKTSIELPLYGRAVRPPLSLGVGPVQQPDEDLTHANPARGSATNQFTINLGSGHRRTAALTRRHLPAARSWRSSAPSGPRTSTRPARWPSAPRPWLAMRKPWVWTSVSSTNSIPGSLTLGYRLRTGSLRRLETVDFNRRRPGRRVRNLR
jgi:hypothetical protein